MQAKKRYAIVLLTIAIGFLLYTALRSPRRAKPASLPARDRLPTFEDSPSYADFAALTAQYERRSKSGPCTMGRCFNRTKCKRPFKVYVYPDPDPSSVPTMSEAYEKIVKAIRMSNMYTSDPEEACLFVLSFDTLDRDRISEHYVKNLNALLASLPSRLWNEGRNHLIFNLYHGSYPDYKDDDFGFDPQLAMMARASTSVRHFRPDYDVSFPLFHKELPLRSSLEPVLPVRDASQDEHLVSFKGKRYVYGIGSETRNSVYHLHNQESVVMLTTCKHGNDWQKMADERCKEDNAEYDRWDYDSLMANSTFCLVPRGRRLGSFRFLESLRAGCVPVVLSDDWELPFSEVIDWSRAVVRAHERTLLQVPEMLRSIPPSRVVAMKQQGRSLFRHYFSSVEKIVSTALMIVFDRLEGDNHRHAAVWNDGANALLHLPSFSSHLKEYPMFLSSVDDVDFTSVIYCSDSPSSHLLKLVAALSTLPRCQAIVLLWASQREHPKLLKHRKQNAPPITIIDIPFGNRSELFIPRAEIVTTAVFTIDDRVQLSADEIEFALQSWRWFPSRLVGYFGRSHVYRKQSWSYSSQPLNHYSLILPDAAVFHRYYLSLYWVWLSRQAAEQAGRMPECHDLLFNAMLTEYTSRPPILLANRSFPPTLKANASSPRATCFDQLLATLWDAKPPFLKSVARLDPVLFLDNVSNFRKQYRQMEVPVGAA